jgi:mannose-1-phosphate guanylyltransferase
MQALILVGGQGTRLRPLTSLVPKPVVSLVDRPFLGYMLEWLARHGVHDAILSCGFLPDGIREVLGDGGEYGVTLRYVEEPHPLGTGGALKYAEEYLDESFFMLNGDVLTDIDLTAQLAQHRATGARATLGLIGVDDPSAYGLVRRDEHCAVTEFLEKPGPDVLKSGLNLINAGAYIIEREVLSEMAPAGTEISIERELFPHLVGEGLYGYEASGYWMDIGTPDRYLQATFDILEGTVTTEIGAQLADAGSQLVGDARIDGRVIAPAVIGDGCEIADGAIVGGRTVLGRNVKIGPGARIDGSVLLDGVTIGARTTISGAIIAAGATIGEHCHIDDGAMVGADVELGADNTLTAGARIFPGVTLPAGAIGF